MLGCQRWMSTRSAIGVQNTLSTRRGARPGINQDRAKIMCRSSPYAKIPQRMSRGAFLTQRKVGVFVGVESVYATREKLSRVAYTVFGVLIING